MLLYHQDLIDTLSKDQLLKQHYEICKIRSQKWNQDDKDLEYIYKHPYQYLYAYHLLIIEQLEKHHHFVNPLWKDAFYRGMKMGLEVSNMTLMDDIDIHNPIYPEHDLAYYQKCLKYLKK